MTSSSRKQQLFLWLYRNNLLLFFLIFSFLFIVPLAEGVEIGLSPDELVFEEMSGKISCLRINIMSKGYDGAAMLTTKWLPEYYTKSKSLRDYILSEKQREIEVLYPKQVVFTQEYLSIEPVDICFKATKNGEYNGLLLVEPIKGVVAVGAWIHGRIYGGELTARAARDFSLSGLVFQEGNKDAFFPPEILLAEEIFLMLLFGSLLIFEIYLRRKYTKM